jgi:hypothetical protein
MAVSGALGEAGSAGCLPHGPSSGAPSGGEFGVQARSGPALQRGGDGTTTDGPTTGWVQVVKAGASRRWAAQRIHVPILETPHGRQRGRHVQRECQLVCQG